MKTVAQKWSEEHRKPAPQVDALAAEYRSMMTKRLRIFSLARELEAERDALKAQVKELAAALTDVITNFSEHIGARTVECEVCVSSIAEARVALDRVSK